MQMRRCAAGQSSLGGGYGRQKPPLGRQKRTYAAKKQDSRKHMGVSPREAGRKN